MTITHTETLMPTQLRTRRAAPKSVGQALVLIAAAVVLVGLGVVATAAYLVVPQPTQTTIVRPGATSPSISITWWRHAQ
jgi:hypothetical protein